MDAIIIQQKIFEIRGEKVMLDFDLAILFDVETKVLNQAVKRNGKRFPADFMFQLSQREYDNLKSQFVTSSWGGTRKLPFAFTELCKIQRTGREACPTGEY
jgi:superfamily I DNA and RNA helicase